jgi:hypothetical protein
METCQNNPSLNAQRCALSDKNLPVRLSAGG